MKHLTILLAMAGWAGGAIGDPGRATADEVLDRVQRAVELLAERRDGALDLLRDPHGEFVWKDSYVFVVNCDADRVVSNPAFPQRVGGDIKQHTDYAGYRYGAELCRTAAQPGGGWVEYTWLPRGSDTPLSKRSYVRSVPGTPYQVGAGVYEPATTGPRRERQHNDDH